MSEELPPEDDEISSITHALERVDKGKVSAFVKGDKVFLMIRNAPEDLRRLADALETIGVSEIDTILAVEKDELQRLPFGSGLRDAMDSISISRKPGDSGADANSLASKTNKSKAVNSKTINSKTVESPAKSKGHGPS